MTSHRKPKPDLMDLLYAISDLLAILKGWLYMIAGCSHGRIWWIKVGWYVADPFEEWGEL